MARQRDENKIVDIQQAAMKLIIKTGFVGLKMAEVAKEAGIATGTLYIYFKDKEALINQAYIATKQEIAKVLLSPDNQGANFYESFRRMWFAYIRFCMSEPEKMFFVEQFLHSGYLSEVTVTAGEHCFQPFTQFVEAAQEQGLLRKDTVEILKAQLMGPIHEFVKLGLEKGMPWLESQLESGFEMAWEAVRR